MEKNKIKYLIADTTAFINNVQLNEYAENIITVPDVVNEVKNKRQIRRLVVLPYDLQVREPNSESQSFVTNFAKKTGDYASLSAIDMKVIALTYELQKECSGSDNLRTEPIQSRIVASKEKPVEFIDCKLAGFYVPSNTSQHNTVEKTDSCEISADKLQNSLDNLTLQNQEKGLDIDNILHPSKEEDESDSEYDEEECHSILYPSKEQEENDYENGEEECYNNQIEDCFSQDCNDNDDEWITPSNIIKKKKEFEGNTNDKIPAVACISTDFAIQNVLKQINLHILALNGRVIKHLRTYILRCYSCFKTTSVMTKLFCPNCGNKTLKRVAVSLDENGQQVIHINTRRPLTCKYKNQSLARPTGGKHSRNPIIVEDQPIPKQMPSRVAKTKTNALDEDYVNEFSPFVVRDINSKSALLRSKGNIKEWARNNTFEENRRKKHFNRLVK